jgi:regulation of enolase protein 1 (concanavalin A-like superfamily)
VNGEGADIWDTSDQFNYLYQTTSGDLTITARVASQQNTNAWAKAGVMVRETTATNSAYVFMMVTPGNGVSMQYRSSTGATAATLGKTLGPVAPYWVQLVRAGNTFTGFSSADGVTWTQFGSINVTMASNAAAGLAVTSHNTSALNTSTFDNVSITTPAPDFTLTATPSSQTVTVGAGTSYTANVGSLNGFSGTVSLSVSGLPTGATGSFSPTSISGGSGSSTLSVATASTTPAGTYTLTITGTSGSLSHAATVTLVINAVQTIQFVQLNSNNNTSAPPATAISVAVKYTSAQTAGDMNIIAVGWTDTTTSVSSVTDSSGNTYTLAIGPTRVAADLSQSIYYAKGIKAAAAGSNTVTVNFNAAAASPDIRIAEYSGVSALDTTAGATGSSRSVDS